MTLKTNIKQGDHIYLSDKPGGKKVTLWGKVMTLSTFSVSVSRRGGSGVFRMLLDTGVADYGRAHFLVHVKPAAEAVDPDPEAERVAIEALLAKK